MTQSKGPGNPQRKSYPFPASTWLVVGVLGILLFGVGIWEPAWTGVPGGAYLEIAMAAAGGSLLVLGFTYYSRARPSMSRVRWNELVDGKTVIVEDFRDPPTRGKPRESRRSGRVAPAPAPGPVSSREAPEKR